MTTRAQVHEIDILEWSSRLAFHLDGKTWNDLDREITLQDAVVRCIVVVGEAAGQPIKVSPDHPSKNDLRKAYLTCNALTHGYEGVRHDIVWQTATGHVPELAERLHKR